MREQAGIGTAGSSNGRHPSRRPNLASCESLPIIVPERSTAGSTAPHRPQLTGRRRSHSLPASGTANRVRRATSSEDASHCAHSMIDRLLLASWRGTVAPAACKRVGGGPEPRFYSRRFKFGAVRPHLGTRQLNLLRHNRLMASLGRLDPCGVADPRCARATLVCHLPQPPCPERRRPSRSSAAATVANDTGSATREGAAAHRAERSRPWPNEVTCCCGVQAPLPCRAAGTRGHRGVAGSPPAPSVAIEGRCLVAGGRRRPPGTGCLHSAWQGSTPAATGRGVQSITAPAALALEWSKRYIRAEQGLRQQDVPTVASGAADSGTGATGSMRNPWARNAAGRACLLRRPHTQRYEQLTASLCTPCLSPDS